MTPPNPMATTPNFTVVKRTGDYGWCVFYPDGKLVDFYGTRKEADAVKVEMQRRADILAEQRWSR